MSKRIDELVYLAFVAGQRDGFEAAESKAPVMERTSSPELRAVIKQQNAARDALEADITELIDRAQGLADKARQYSGCDLFDQADALDAAVTRLLNGGEG